MPEPDELFARAAEKIGVRLSSAERAVVMRLTRPYPCVNQQSIADLEMVESILGREPKRSDPPCPVAEIFDAACKASAESWVRHVLVSILSWRWQGVGELATARTLIAQQIEQRKGAAA